MQISAEKLSVFTDKATLGCLIPNFLLIIKDKKISAVTKDLSNAALTAVTMTISASDEMSLPIKDVKMFSSALKLFTGNIEVIRDNNILSLYNKNKQVDIVLAEENYIDCAIEKIPDKLVWDASVEIDSGVFKNAVKNSSVTKTEDIIIKLDGQNLTLISGDKEFDKIKETIPATYAYPVETKYAKFLSDTINVIDGKIKLSIKNDYPCRIEEKTSELEAVYIIAPLVKNE